MDSASPTQSRTVRRHSPVSGAPTFGDGTGKTAESRQVSFLFDWFADLASAPTRHRGAHHRRATGEAHAP